MLWLRLLVNYGKRCHRGEYFDGESQHLDLNPLAHSKVFGISYGFTEALETPVSTKLQRQHTMVWNGHELQRGGIRVMTWNAGEFSILVHTKIPVNS